MSKSQRVKGHGFERLIAQKFRTYFPNARRHLEYHKDDAAKGIDLINVGAFKIQCKRGKRYAPINKINEVKIDCIEGGIPLLITKADNAEAMVAMPLNFFLTMLRDGKHEAWLE